MPGSPFYPDPVPIGDPIKPLVPKKDEKQTFPAMPRGLNRGPSKVELEDWYHSLDEIVRELEPGRLHETLLDLRDEVYKHLN